MITAAAANISLSAEDKAENLEPFIGLGWIDEGVSSTSSDRAVPLRTARPFDGLKTLFPATAYPAAAVARGLEGSAVLSIALSEKGVVLNCNIIQQKGDPILYKDACVTVRQHGRFLARLNEQGVAVPSNGRITIDWRLLDPTKSRGETSTRPTRRIDRDHSDTGHWNLYIDDNVTVGTSYLSIYYPVGLTLPKTASTGVDFTVLPDRTISNCRVRLSSGSPEIDAASCSGVTGSPAIFRYKPSRQSEVSAFVHWRGANASLELADYRKTRGPSLVQTLKLSESDRPMAVQPPFPRAAVEAKVSTGGGVTGCIILNSSGSDAYDIKACALIKERAVFSAARNGFDRPTYGAITIIFDWNNFTAYWPLDLSAKAEEWRTACEAGMKNACIQFSRLPATRR